MQVTGRVERFRDELQIEVRRSSEAKADGLDPADFLPIAYRDMEELDGFLEHLAREVHDSDLRRLLGAFLERPSLPRRAAPRAVHARRPPRLPRRAARAHGGRGHAGARDVHAAPAAQLRPPDRGGDPARLGKTREFSYGAEISLSEEGALLGHVALGQQMIAERASRLGGFPQQKLLALTHCVLGHHGPDALPGRRYRSAEALALARLNAVDAAVKGALEHGLPT